jgi:hypothetical protein
MKTIRITNTLKAIRSYKNGIGNYMDLSEEIKQDASNYVNAGKPLAFWRIEAREAGNPVQDSECLARLYMRCCSDAIQAIYNKIHKALPAGLKNCRMYKDDMLWFGGW